MANRYLDPLGDDTWNGAADSPIKETLSVQLNAGHLASLTVTGNTNDFASSGKIRIDNEFISYTGKTADTLTGLTRGENASADVVHLVGAVIYQCDISWGIVGPYKTIAIILGDATGNKLYAASGYYIGNGAFIGSVEIYASGKNVIFDGDNSYNYCIDSDDNIIVEGIEFRNYLLAGVRHNNNANCDISIRLCRFLACGVGVKIEGTNYASATIAKNVFDSNVTGLEWSKGDGGSIIINNTFVSNTNGWQMDAVMHSSSRLWNNAFKGSTIALLMSALANMVGSLNFNGYHGNTNVARDVGGATDYGTLILWQAACGAEGNSLSSDPLMNDITFGMYGLQPTSPWRTAGVGQFPIGAFGVSYGISANINSSLWGANGEMDNTQVLGDVVALLTSPSGTFATDILDMGQSRSIRDIRVFGVEDRPDSVFDSDKTDEYPNLLTIEARGDNITFLKDAAEAGDLVYDEFERDAEPVLVNGNAQRFVQVRITLRDDGI